MKLRTILLGIAALFVAFNAAFFSITGLSQLFAGASLSVIIMASSLELAKIMSAAFLYNYWKRINKAFRGYLLAGIIVLILITSAGIYGFLTSAFQTTSDKLNVLDNQTEVLTLKKNRFETQLNTYVVEKGQITESINELSRGLSNNVIQYRDTATNTIITTTSGNTRRVLERQLNDAKAQRDKLSIKIETLSDSATNIDIKILDLKSNTELTSDLGPLRYLSKITGRSMDTIVNWFALLIIFVFDPLAVALIVAFNISLRVDREEDDGIKKVQEKPLVVESEVNKEDPKLRRSFFDDKFPKLRISKKKKENNVSHQPSKVKTDVVSTKKEFHKADENKDGIIDDSEERKFYEEGGWKDSHNGVPYFKHPWFDWDDLDKWVGDIHAENYWIRNGPGTYAKIQEIRKERKN